MLFSEKDITVVMTTYNNNDFTKASVWSIKKYYPELRVILTDGGSTNENYLNLIELTKEIPNVELVQYYGGATEDCRNIGARIVNTEFILFMDNDTKFLDISVIPIMLDVMKDDNIAETGVYAIKIVDEKAMKSYVGNIFTDYMEVDGFSAYCALHRKKYFDEIGGMPKEHMYDFPKEILSKRVHNGYSGDYAISRHYKEKGYKMITPKERVPVIHWGQAYRWNRTVEEFEKWFYENAQHIRCNPLNNWKEIEYGGKK